MFAKIMRKMSVFFRQLQRDSIAQAMPAIEDEEVAEMNGDALKSYDAAETLDQMDKDLEEAGSEAISAMKEKQKELINSLNLDKYAIDENNEDWKDSTNSLEKAAKSNGVVSVKTGKKRKTENAQDIYNDEMKSVKKGKQTKKRK